MSQRDEALLERQLQWVMKRWDIVSPAVFAAMVDGETPMERDAVLLTFDDGTVSNLHVAARVLQPMGIRALFFVVAQYALLGEKDDWREFAATRIMLNRPNDVPENFRNMTVADLKWLVRAGHTIGAHTATHARLSSLSGEALREEIVGGGDVLEQHLAVPIQHFAYPFGDFKSLSASAAQIARHRFRYVYTALRGDNGRDRLGGHIRRDSNDPHDSLWYTGACLEGGVDFLYRKHYLMSRER